MVEQLEFEGYEWNGTEHGKGNDWGTDQGLWIGMLANKKNKPSFSKTSEFDQATHKSKSWKSPNANPRSIHEAGIRPNCEAEMRPNCEAEMRLHCEFEMRSIHRGVPRETIVGYEEEEHELIMEYHGRLLIGSRASTTSTVFCKRMRRTYAENVIVN